MFFGVGVLCMMYDCVEFGLFVGWGDLVLGVGYGDDDVLCL